MTFCQEIVVVIRMFKRNGLAGEQVLGFVKYEKMEWVSDTTWALIFELRNLNNKVNVSKSRVERFVLVESYNDLYRKLKRRARNDSELAAKVQSAVDYWHMAKKILNKIIVTEQSVQNVMQTLILI